MTEQQWPAGVSRPAQRALGGAGYERLAQLDGVSERALRELHGMGPKALGALKEALAGQGKSLAP